MVLGLFSKERGLKKARKKALSRFAQGTERMWAMEKLLDHGDDESLLTLCRRFSITSQKLSEDEEEKAWVVRSLVAQGSDALPALREYMLEHQAIAYPLRVLESSADKDKALEIIDELLEKEAPGYSHDVDKRISLITWLAEWEEATNDEVVARIAPYLADFDENVRFATAEAIDERATQEAAEPLIEALLNPEEESGRLKERILEVLENHGLTLGDRKKDIASLLQADSESDYRVQKNKIVKRKR